MNDPNPIVEEEQAVTAAGMPVDDFLDNIDADKVKIDGLTEALTEFQTGNTWDELEHSQKVGVTESLKLLRSLSEQFAAILGE